MEEEIVLWRIGKKGKRAAGVARFKGIRICLGAADR